MDWNKEIKLRKLTTEDAEPMLAWMKNPDIYKNMQYNPDNQTLERCKMFIKNSWTDESNLHFAVTDADERYMGTQEQQCRVCHCLVHRVYGKRNCISGDGRNYVICV